MKSSLTRARPALAAGLRAGRIVRRGATAAVILALAAMCILLGTASQATASGPQLVTTCQAQPCANAQEFTVADDHGAPIFSVGEYGGTGVFGDNASVYAPGDVYQASTVMSWGSPAQYYEALRKPVPACRVPSAWYAPTGIWECAAGRWRQVVKL